MQKKTKIETKQKIIFDNVISFLKKTHFCQKLDFFRENCFDEIIPIYISIILFFGIFETGP